MCCQQMMKKVTSRLMELSQKHVNVTYKEVLQRPKRLVISVAKMYLHDRICKD